MRPGPAHALDIGRSRDSALAHRDHVGGKLGNERLGQAEIGAEDREVTVIHADDARAVIQGAAEFVLAMDLKERVESRRVGGGEKSGDLGVVQGTHDDQDGTGSGFHGLENLDRVDHEILPQAGQGWGRRPKVSRDRAEIVERSTKVLVVGQHGKGTRGGGLVALGLSHGRDVGRDRARGRGTALDFGDDAELTVGRSQGGSEGRRARQALAERAQLAEVDGADGGGDLLPLPRHDFGKLVGHVHG